MTAIILVFSVVFTALFIVLCFAEEYFTYMMPPAVSLHSFENCWVLLVATMQSRFLWAP